jgi:hypothetical protein
MHRLLQGGSLGEFEHSATGKVASSMLQRAVNSLISWIMCTLGKAPTAPAAPAANSMLAMMSILTKLVMHWIKGTTSHTGK